MRHSLALILLLSLIACSSTSAPDLDASGKPRSAGEIYADAMKEMDDHNYEKSGKLLESLISRYPYGAYAQQAQMELAYAYYKQGDADSLMSALSAADRFLKQYPTSPHVDYVYYLKGMINFNSNIGIFNSLFPSDPSEHDPQSIQDSFDAFKQLVTRFPTSKYTPDARVRMQYLANTLATHELDVARYYFRRGAYIAAVNRAKTVISDYVQTPQTRDALKIMVQSYDAMGMKDLRDDAQRVLDLNSKSAAKTVPDTSVQNPNP